MTLISAADASVPVTVQARTDLAPTRAFEIIVPIDLSMVFTGWGPFPGVRGATNQTGAWDHVGASRNPDLSDGSTATETLTEYTNGHSFAYELTNFTNMLGWVASGVRGEWTFTPDGDGTLIRWTYEFRPRPHMAALLRFGLTHYGVDTCTPASTEQLPLRRRWRNNPHQAELRSPAQPRG